MSSLIQLVILCAVQLCLGSGMAQAQSGYIRTSDGVRLYYEKAGSGSRTVIVPGRLFLWPTVRQLGDEYTVIAYDMRDRGKSSHVSDPRKITIQADVADLERIRRHFHVDRAALIGYSYLGMMVMLYALQHPGHVERVVQLGPVPLRWNAQFPPSLVDQSPSGVDSAAVRRLDAQRQSGKTSQRQLCEAQWAVDRYGLVGDPAHVGRLGSSLCDMPNEWPMNLRRHFTAHFETVRMLHHDWPEFASFTKPVLTIHGTRDRNAPYGSGREWALHLPNARLLTINGAAHQAFAEYPDVVLPAIRTFLAGGWPPHSEHIEALAP